MIDCRVNRLLTIAAAALACVAAGALGAATSAAAGSPAALRLAQVGPPVQLTPLKRPPAQPRPPAAEQPTPARTEEGPAEAPIMPGPVTVDRLQVLDPASVGLVEDAQGGLGVAMWRGTSRTAVERLVPLVPAGMRSRTGRDLTRRLLLTRATAPEDDTPGGNLVALRAERLLELGDRRSATALLRLAPPQADDESYARLEVEALFFENDNAGACGKVQNAAHQAIYWQQARAFCFALAGDHARAVVIADLLREQGNDLDPVFFAAIDALGGDANATVDKLSSVNGLQLAMARAAKLKLPDGIADLDRPVVLAAAARMPTVALETRLRAAERAASFAALTPEELGEFYLSVPFSPDELSQPTARADAAWGPRTRALLVRAAAAASSPTAAAEILRHAFRLGREKGGLEAVVAGSVRPLTAIQPSAELAWFAPDAARALFAIGQRDQAMAWIKVANQAAASGPEAKAAADALDPLVRIAAPEEATPLPPKPVAAKRPGEDGAAAARRTYMIQTLLAATARTAGPMRWTAHVGTDAPRFGAAPDPVLWQALTSAAREGRTGETVLLSLIALGPGGTANNHPLTFSAVIEALRAIGLEKDARAIALEAAIAAGA